LAAPIRRNDPCPCGSGRRYKDCHGRLDAAEPTLDALVRRSLEAHRQGRIDEAERGYREILGREPGHPVATHYLGLAAWQRGRIEEAESMMRAALAADASIPDFHNNLGLLLRDTTRLDEAIGCFRRTLEVDPGWYEAYNNLGLALEAAGRSDEAIAAWRAAIAAQPGFAAARQNLGRALVARGDYAEGWEQYRWRLLAQGLAPSAPDPGARPFGPSLAGRRFALLAEQGLGDVLFFLRFAPELAGRGAKLAFRGDARLHGMVERTGLFELGVAREGEAAAGMEPLALGDLPWLLEARDPACFPRALPLAPLAGRAHETRSALEALGPRPWIALTWRAGVASTGPSRTQVKEIAPARLGAALRGLRATWIGVQRLPRAGDYEAVAQALGAPVHDWSAANDDLERMLAIQSCVDDYVAVSNANVHLRAGTGRSMRLLVPYPAEWRWAAVGPGSPWFPEARVHRQEAGGAWDAALGELRSGLEAALHGR